MRSTSSPRISCAAERRHGTRSGLAVLLCRHHGAGDARRHQPPAPRQEIFRLPFHHLHQPGLDRLHRRHRPARRPRSARDGEIRPRRDLGHQRGQHPGQCHDARDPRPQGARRQDRRRRRLHERHHGAGRSAGAAPARHRRRARLRGDALPVPRRQGRLGFSASVTPMRRTSSRRISRRATRIGRRAITGCDVATIEEFARLVGDNQAHLFPPRLRLLALAQRRRQHACGELHRRGDRRLAATKAAARSTTTARSITGTRP